METTYIAHGRAVAQMILDRRTLKEIGFLAAATLEPGRKIDEHVDPMEEIYFILRARAKITSHFMHPGFRPSLSDPQLQNPRNSSLFLWFRSLRLPAASDRTILT